ncbi:class A beta-lactamase [Promicromonospora sp. NPDC057138]|uniref:class A beta-lactamase n=1 Tax=Promicromonospora sp. NPDC057138 TaxID=3346031 RepID=UPI003644DB81
MSYLNLRRSAVLVVSAALLLTACTMDDAGPGRAPGPPAPGATAPVTPTATPTATPRPTPPRADVGPAVDRLEEKYDADVGLYAVDTGTGRVAAHGEDERFAFASTYKALAAGAVLERSSAADLRKVVMFDAEDLVEYSPVTEQHVGDGMTMLQIIDAAVEESDNTAGNLLFDALGGPSGMQAALRAIGDETTVSARYEPELNEVAPGDDRDTSTAEALAADLRAYVLGDVLGEDDRRVLVEALRGSVTGAETIRAGVPDGWVVGNKTGTSGNGGRNDIGVVWPPGREPLVLAVLTQTEDPDAEPADALLAEVTAVAVEALGR